MYRPLMVDSVTLYLSFGIVNLCVCFYLVFFLFLQHCTNFTRVAMNGIKNTNSTVQDSEIRESDEILDPVRIESFDLQNIR